MIGQGLTVATVFNPSQLVGAPNANVTITVQSMTRQNALCNSDPSRDRIAISAVLV